jgi:uncharacterized glyoxalase superfamily protein PhnB
VACTAHFILHVADQARSTAFYAGSPRVSRAELYLRVADPAAAHARALDAGATELSPLELRSWGDRAAYSVDLDGHILAFASL